MKEVLSKDTHFIYLKANSHHIQPSKHFFFNESPSSMVSVKLLYFNSVCGSIKTTLDNMETNSICCVPIRLYL